MKKNHYTAVNFTDVDNNWTAAEFDNTNKDNGALDAHWGRETHMTTFQLNTRETVMTTLALC
jgi:hypothetical protein